jgi:hypothetical protein
LREGGRTDLIGDGPRCLIKEERFHTPAKARRGKK